MSNCTYRKNSLSAAISTCQLSILKCFDVTCDFCPLQNSLPSIMSFSENDIQLGINHI